MLKGVIPSGGTGLAGVKYEHLCWVIKVTIDIANANQMDNALSPMASGTGIKTVGDEIFLKFNQLTMRH